CHVSESAQMELCDATGRLIHQCRLEPGDNIFQAPDIQGIYIIRVQTERDRTKVLKLFVQ
ncbi:MAG: T9SS type A sorting domain-containing protein, partial [Paludibacteraceae bacterium]|nr:T9SS type A sorting domain-containing protein [Paludibacteraceae bacterium]